MTEKTNIIEGANLAEIEKNLREKILAEYKAREKANNLKLAIASRRPKAESQESKTINLALNDFPKFNLGHVDRSGWYKAGFKILSEAIALNIVTLTEKE